MADPISLTLGVVSVVGGLVEHNQQRQAMEDQQHAADRQFQAQQDAQRVQSNQVKYNNDLARMKALRDNRARQASMIAAGVASGGLGGTESSNLLGSLDGSNAQSASAQGNAIGLGLTGNTLSGLSQTSAHESYLFNQAGVRARQSASDYKLFSSVVSQGGTAYNNNKSTVDGWFK